MLTCEIYKDKDKQFRFRFKSGNGQIILVGESYTRRSSAIRGVKSFINAFRGKIKMVISNE